MEMSVSRFIKAVGREDLTSSSASTALRFVCFWSHGCFREKALGLALVGPRLRVVFPCFYVHVLASGRGRGTQILHCADVGRWGEVRGLWMIEELGKLLIARVAESPRMRHAAVGIVFFQHEDDGS